MSKLEPFFAQQNSPGVLMVSGGIDSTTLMYAMAKNKCLVAAFFVDYGQASAEEQLRLLTIHTKQLHVPLMVQKIPWPEYARGKGYIFKKGEYPEPLKDPYEVLEKDAEGTERYFEEQWDFLQGRNIAFLAYGAAYALSMGCNSLYTAFQFDEPEWASMDKEDDYSAWVDTSPWFVKAFNQLGLCGGFTKRLTVKAPFLDSRMFKQDIVDLGRSLGVPLQATYSCEFYPPCGSCHQCKIRSVVLAQKTAFR